MTLYEVSVEVQNDLFEIWRRIAGDSVELAERIQGEFHETCSHRWVACRVRGIVAKT